MIYELRVYSCLPGRLPNLLKRFETGTLKLWDKHGIRQAGFFTTMVGPTHNDLTYLIAWDSLGDRQAKWSAFIADPAWHALRDESEKDGPIIANIASSFLTPTTFSSVK
jgi:hypothetical protein